MTSALPTLTVSDFVAVFNQTIQYAYPQVTIQGELANFRISKNRWVYFDLKDEMSSVKFFGTVYNLPGPLEEGMVLKVVGTPQLHNLYGFSITVQSIQLAGEGSIKKAAQLLQAKLEKEGLFDPGRKRSLPYPPSTVGLITSGESAAYADFIKIIKARWGGVRIQHFDVQVQGDNAPSQIVQAIEYFNGHASAPEVIVVVRGGGSADDLQAFSSELVTRTIAASRIPTLVAIGHEVDLSLAELAADQRASTPSNAAELLVPDKKNEAHSLQVVARQCHQQLARLIQQSRTEVAEMRRELDRNITAILQTQTISLATQRSIIELASPQRILQRGFAVIRKNGKTVRRRADVRPADQLSVQLQDGSFTTRVEGEV